MSSSDGDNNKPPESAESAVEVASYHDIDYQMGEFQRNVEVNERMLQQLQDYELMLLEASSLPALLDVLLLATREHFELLGTNLTLYDPEDLVAELMPEDLVYPGLLQLVADSFDLQRLYGVAAEVEAVPVSDPRARQAMPDTADLQTMIMLPLIRDGQIVGSFHLGSSQVGIFSSDIEMDFMAHLAAIVSICLENCINAERLSQLSLLDPLTRTGNARSFGMELRKEISRAQRNQKSLSMIYLRLDDFKSITDNHGHLSGDFVLKAVSGSIADTLRHTDHIARCEPDLFGILLPACSEVKGQELSERLRSETEFMEINDNRGAHLFASLAIGMTCWNPQTYPAVNMEQLAGQMLNSANLALLRASEAGGNRVAVTRLTTMMV
jgi:diguanylate cyclase (GGDEF)-like protein